MRFRNNKLINFILEISQVILVFLGVYSALLCTATSLELTYSRGACALVMLLAAVLFYGLFTVLETFHHGKMYGILGISLFFAMIIFYFWSQVCKGLVVMVNNFLKGFMSFTGSKLSLLALDIEHERASTRFCTSFVLILLGVYLIVLISAFFYRRRRPSVFLVLTIPFVFLPLLVGRLGYFSNMFTYLIVMLAVIGTRHQKTDATDRRMRQKLSVLLMGMGLVIGAISWLYMPPERYEENQSEIGEARNSVVALMNWSVEDIFAWMKAHLNGDVIDYGTVGGTDQLSYTGETILKISGTVNNLHGLYLKGYVGDLYEDNQWSSLRGDSEYMTELAELEEKGLSPENWFFEMYHQLEGRDQAKDLDALGAVGTIRIRNMAFGYGNYVIPYLPTSPFLTEDNGRITNSTLGIDYSVEYFLVYPYILRNNLLGNAQAIASDSFWTSTEVERLKMEKFAKKYYLQVPESLTSVCDDFKKYLEANRTLYSLTAQFDQAIQDSGSAEQGDSNLTEILNIVKNYITKDTEYTLSPGKTPKDRETVEYFLEENKKGYCTYYATAAAMLLRSVGIPTRYVEGVYVSPEELTEATENNTEILVPDSDAHAWIEVFDDQYGFVPVEVTPGKEEDEFGQSRTQNSDPQPDSEDDPDDSSVEEPELVTPTPSVTEEPQEDMIFDDIESSGDSDEEEPEGGLGAFSNGKWKLAVEILAALLLVILILEGERRIRRYLFMNRLQRLRMKRKIRMIHHHVMPLLSARGASYKGRSLADYSAVIAEAMGMPLDQITEYVNMVYHARFGPDDITDAQFAGFRMQYDQIRRKAYNDAKIMKKLYYMYIMVL